MGKRVEQEKKIILSEVIQTQKDKHVYPAYGVLLDTDT